MVQFEKIFIIILNKRRELTILKKKLIFPHRQESFLVQIICILLTTSLEKCDYKKNLNVYKKFLFYQKLFL